MTGAVLRATMLLEIGRRRSASMGLWDAFKSVAVNAAGQGFAQAVHTHVATKASDAAAQQQASAQMAPDVMMGSEYEPIFGVSLDLYANLLALMSDFGADEDRCEAVAAENGVSREAWEGAKSGWTARMADPSLENRVAKAFLTFYGPALERKRGGCVPMSLERYSQVFAETSFRKDPTDPFRQIDREVVLGEHGLSLGQWNEALVYWSPKVSDANDPAATTFGQLVQQASLRLMNAG